MFLQGILYYSFREKIQYFFLASLFLLHYNTVNIYPNGRGFMRCLVQRGTEASARVDGVLAGEIGKGFLILLGISKEDTKEIAGKMAQKVLAARIFEDREGKTNCSLSDVDGEVLIISQFTLYADVRKGNRPSFYHAGEPKDAEGLYRYFSSLFEGRVRKVQLGIFGADMKVRLLNDGPFTLMYDSEDLLRPRNA